MNYTKKSVNHKIEDLTSATPRRKKHIAMFLLTSVMAVLLASLIIGIFTFAGAFQQIIRNAPDLNNLDSIRPTETKSIIYASDGSVMQELVQSGSNRETVTIDKIPKNLQNAFVAIEDARFFTHNGVDIKGIFRAIYVALTSGNLSEGASTITQQLIKNNIFDGGMETNLGDRLERKFQEQYLALKVEEMLPKETILQYYLNSINLGNNCLGVQVASKRYFNKDVSQLDLAECTVLAAITQNPSRFNPITHPDYNQERRATVLSNMLRSGMITQVEYDEAILTEVYDRIQLVSSENSSERHAFSYFTDAVFEDVVAQLQEQLGYTETQAYNLMYSGGLRIHSTMDQDYQDIVDREVNDPNNYIVTTNGTSVNYAEYSLSYRLTIRLHNGKEYYYTENSIKNYYQNELGQPAFSLVFQSEEDLMNVVDTYRENLLNRTRGSVVSETITSTLQPQTSFVLMDQSNGHVLALVGGRGDKDEIGSLVLNRATSSTRQPGSAFKTLASYSPAIDISGDTLASTYYDAPYSFEDKTISNWWGTQYMGYANIRYALAASMNIIAVKCQEDTVSENLAYKSAEDYGISTLVQQDKSPVFTLGGLTYGVTNLELTAAYAAIANQGSYVEPIYWTTITDADGNVILENTQDTRTVIKPTSASLLTSALETTVESLEIWPQYGLGATNTACQLVNMAAAGKSGTTTDANDIWFIGYTPYYTAGIWSGYDSNKSFGESPGYHKTIWQHIMQQISDSVEPAEFDYSSLETATICSKSGLLAVDGVCDHTDDPSSHVYDEYFAPGTAPTQYCNRHVTYKVCSVSGELATSFCPPNLVEDLVYLVIDAKDNDGSITDDTIYTAPASLLSSSCHIHTRSSQSQSETTEAESTEEETDEHGDVVTHEETSEEETNENASEASDTTDSSEENEAPVSEESEAESAPVEEAPMAESAENESEAPVAE